MQNAKTTTRKNKSLAPVEAVEVIEVIEAVEAVEAVAEYKAPTLLELAAQALAETKEKRSAGVAASHANATAEQKAIRATQHGVLVTIGAETAAFSSLEKAINKLGVPKLFTGYKGGFTSFRQALKAEKTKSYSKDGVEYVFAIAE